MSTKTTLMLLTTETPLHAGAGQSVAGIDLPIQREIHTQWPCVYGSAVKGALRARAEQLATDKTSLLDLFGPDHAAAAGERDSSHAGALLVGDAHLLLLPVRSLQSCFKWVTCPAILRRLQRDAARLGLNLELPTLPAISGQTALGDSEQSVFLEEFRLAQSASSEQQAIANALHELYTQLDLDELRQRLIIVSDDIFSFLARNATSINAHIALDSQTKTVTQGALWYEESLPPETLLYVPLTATAARRKGSALGAQAVLSHFAELFAQGRNYLQLGGNETTGMGWCHVQLHNGQA